MTAWLNFFSRTQFNLIFLILSCRSQFLYICFHYPNNTQVSSLRGAIFPFLLVCVCVEEEMNLCQIYSLYGTMLMIIFPSSPPPSSLPLPYSPSTEELVRSQTDWLKEFQQSVPPASQLRRASAGCLRPTSAPPSPPSSSVYPSARRREMSSVSTGLEPASSAALPRRPKLVLDDNNNIQLVHV